MTALREAAQQALEALEATHYDVGSAERQRLEAVDAITALRAALAQQEDIAQNLQSRLDAAMLLEERRQEIAQPHRETEQEPTVRIKCTVVDNQHPSGVPFEQWVNAPRREWRSLTNEELNRIESQARSHDGLNLSFLFLEIQQALKEKNHG